MRWAILVMPFLLVSCSNDEHSARAELTKGQQLVAGDKYVDAIKVFESVAARFPHTAAATDAMRELKPLKAERFTVILACTQYHQDTGQNLIHANDLLIKPSLVDGWRGPYVTAAQLHHFGDWMADLGCKE